MKKNETTYSLFDCGEPWGEDEYGASLVKVGEEFNGDPIVIHEACAYMVPIKDEAHWVPHSAFNMYIGDACEDCNEVLR